MDRRIVYPGSIPIDLDILGPQQNAMVALGYLMQAAFGSSTLFDGLACLPTSPASMSVQVGPGSVLSIQALEATAFGSIGSDTSDTLVKMGVNRASTTLSFTAPTVAGQSQCYLIEGSFLEQDTSPTVLTYYNSANPSIPFSGPNNSGTPQNTVRTQSVNLQVKTGAAATTGSQTVPPADTGWFGLWVITVQTGQSSITAASIAMPSGAPFIAAKIPGLAPLISAALVGTPTAPTPSPGDASTRIATMAALASAIAPFSALGGQQLVTSTGNFTVPANVTKIRLSGSAPGGSGGGGYSNAGSLFAGGGGSSGQWILNQVFSVTPGQVISVTVPNGPAGGALSTSNGVSATGGTNGATASFGSLISLTGGSAGTGGSPASAGSPGGSVGSGSVIGREGYGMTSPIVTNGAFPGGQGGESPFGSFGRGGCGGDAVRSGGVTDAAFAGQGGGGGIFIVQW